MIRLTRHISLGLTGLLTAVSLYESTPPALVISALLLSLLWIFLSGRFPLLHNLMLPLFVLLVLLGHLFGNSMIIGLLLFYLILFSWDIDSLYFHSKGIILKDDELKLLHPLLMRYILSAFIVGFVWLISAQITISISFWPLAASTLILIVLLKKLFRN